MGSIPIGISGSRAAAVLGMSPWATPFSVYQDIMEKRQPGYNAAMKYDYTPFEGNVATRWGLAFEEAIIQLSELRHNKVTDMVMGTIVDREKAFTIHDYVTCHIDGMYCTLKNQPTILHEGKTTTAYGFGDNWGEPGTDRIPIEYQLQVQHQMLCTGADSCIVSVLVFPERPDVWEGKGIFPLQGNSITFNPDDPSKGGKVIGLISQWATILDQMGFFHQYTVPSNPQVQALMLDKYKKWWEIHIIGETPPEPQDYADIRRLITAPCGTIIVDPDTARWFKEYKDIGSEIGKTGNLSKRRDQLKVLILKHARHVEATLDDESTDKWIFRDGRGNKVGSYSRTATGSMVFR